ncbi:hypothetical protein JCM11251_000611 [Rhodosporidiobolus azoricus]
MSNKQTKPSMSAAPSNKRLSLPLTRTHLPAASLAFSRLSSPLYTFPPPFPSLIG